MSACHPLLIWMMCSLFVYSLTDALTPVIYGKHAAWSDFNATLWLHSTKIYLRMVYYRHHCNFTMAFSEKHWCIVDLMLLNAFPEVNTEQVLRKYLTWKLILKEQYVTIKICTAVQIASWSHGQYIKKIDILFYIQSVVEVSSQICLKSVKSWHEKCLLPYGRLTVAAQLSVVFPGKMKHNSQRGINSTNDSDSVIPLTEQGNLKLIRANTMNYQLSSWGLWWLYRSMLTCLANSGKTESMYAYSDFISG